MNSQWTRGFRWLIQTHPIIMQVWARVAVDPSVGVESEGSGLQNVRSAPEPEVKPQGLELAGARKRGATAVNLRRDIPVPPCEGGVITQGKDRQALFPLPAFLSDRLDTIVLVLAGWVIWNCVREDGRGTREWANAARGTR